jgi:hypothetical protein
MQDFNPRNSKFWPVFNALAQQLAAEPGRLDRDRQDTDMAAYWIIAGVVDRSVKRNRREIKDAVFQQYQSYRQRWKTA